MAKQKKRQAVRSFILVAALLLFPVVLNYLSPYVSLQGAMDGFITGSLLLFAVLFFTALFAGRVFCGWICPGAGLQEICFRINDKRTNNKKLDPIKYLIWAPWFCTILIFLVLNFSRLKFNPLYLTESGISVDAPGRYIIYYAVTGLIFIFSVLIGRRAMCHSICWMAPFMVIARDLRNLVKWPALLLKTDKARCIHCKKCTENCVMSLEVHEMVQTGKIESSGCILCGRCADVCPQNVIRYGFSR